MLCKVCRVKVIHENWLLLRCHVLHRLLDAHTIETLSDNLNLALLCYCPVEPEARADAVDSVNACTIFWMSGAATWSPLWVCHSTRKSKAACLLPRSLSNNSTKHPVCTQDWNLTSEYAQPTRADPFEIDWRQWRHLANLGLTWTPISTMPILGLHRVFAACLEVMLGAFAESEKALCLLSWSLKIFFVSASSLRCSSSHCARMGYDSGTMKYVENVNE